MERPIIFLPGVLVSSAAILATPAKTPPSYTCVQCGHFNYLSIFLKFGVLGFTLPMTSKPTVRYVY